MFEINQSLIRATMCEKQMTVRETARRANMSETTLRTLLNDKATANARTVGRLAAALDVKPSEILK